MRALAGWGLVLWVGVTLVLDRLRWFARLRLTDRLRPHGPAPPPAAAVPASSVRSLGDALRPVGAVVGDTAGRWIGREDLHVRLERVHHPLDPTAFRVRQVGHAAVALAGAMLLCAGLAAPPAVAMLACIVLPALAFLGEEERLQRAGRRRQADLSAELPVVAEQLAMLLASGWSVIGALSRLAERGAGVAADDLRSVCGRVRQGLGEVEALHEWAAVAGVPALDRLVQVLALHRHTADLSRLLADEARAVRSEHHRRLLETLEKRGQQVWIPVTVATLVPGAIFLTVPFVEALRLFTGS